jgi:hypothetical protein
MMTTAILKDLPKGEVFKRKPTARGVYLKGPYSRSCRSYSCSKWDDMNCDILLRPTTIVYINFDF